MKALKNNKGAAMVTVLIAVTFILILASSLLYMSYMNYIAKALRYNSTDMFYTAEYALDDLSSSIQQIAADSTDIATAKSSIITALGIGTNANGKTVYDYDSVESVIQVASKEAVISINSAVQKDVTGNEMENTAIVSANSITLKGVVVTATEQDGYTSTITSDVILNFEPGSIGQMDVNDFSIIADAPVRVKEGDFVVGGNVYIHAPGVVALQVDSAACMELLSNYGIIHGNVQIDGTGILCITGEVTVTGDIYVNDSAVLIVSGDLRHGTIHKAPGARVIGVDNLGDENVRTDGLPASGLAQLLFEEVYVMPDGGSFFETNLAEIRQGVTWVVYKSNTTPQIESRIAMQGTENGLHDSLVLSDQEVTIRGEYSNSTCVCSDKIVLDIVSAPTYMGCMTDEAYQAAKDTLIGSAGRSDFQINGRNCHFQGGMASDISSIAGSAITHPATLNSGAPTDFYFYNNKNYLTIGSLIIDNSSEVITNIFASVGSTALPKNTTILYDNWSKE